MPFRGLSPEDMRRALTELDQALFNHEQWCEGLNRTLICGIAPDDRDLLDDAHCKCRFGQWLYGPGAAKLTGHPGFAEIEATHMRMHQGAQALLAASSRHDPIAIDEYERFVMALKQMRLEVATTKHELEDAIYNLDPLTGVASRIGMLTKLREQQALVKRKVQFSCIAMLDIDHFKAVNDTYGHTTGDRALVAFARHATSHLRPYDLFFRYGGEEFLLCVANAELRTGNEVVERLRVGLAELPIARDGGGTFTITVSAGLTLIDPDVTVEQSIERADRALYAAKAAGRNRIVTWDPSMS